MAGNKSALGALLTAVLAACGPSGPDTKNPTDTKSADPAAFERGEDEILRDLAAIDKRFARRARIEPSEYDLRRVAVTAILHEDPTLAVNDGAIDAFSFDARARGLEAVKAKLAKLPNLSPERELLDRLVGGEVARLEEERTLPRAASALVRALVDTWTAPKDEREAADDDRWLARRLRELRESMASTDPRAQLDVVRARDLDDALDALEKLSGGMTQATQELVKTRDALEALASAPAAKAQSDWPLIAHRLAAQVGVTSSPDELAQSLDALEKDLRARAEEASAGLDRRQLSAQVTERLFMNGACVDAVPGSRVRSLTAPHEREPACHLRKFVAGTSEADRALALATMHDHLVVALWALDVASGKGAIKDAEGRHHMLVPLVAPDVLARLERIALARPATAIGAGIAVRLLASAARTATSDPEARAKAWTALGDVPLDIAARELR